MNTSKHILHRKHKFIPMPVLFMLFLLLCMFSWPEDASAATSDYKLNPRYKVNYEYLNVRAKASISSKKIDELDEGDKVIVTEKKNEWVKIVYGKKYSHTGWVALKYLKRVKDGWVKSNGTYYYWNMKKDETFCSKWMYRANKNIYNIKTSSDVIAVVDKNHCMTYTFYRKDGEWIPHGCYKCNIGMDDWETPAGIFKVNKKLDSFDKYGNTYRYAMRFWGGCFLHSMAYVGDTYTPIVTEGGLKSTHGCVSMKHSEAKWFYKRAEVNKTKIVVVNREFSKWKNW